MKHTSTTKQSACRRKTEATLLLVKALVNSLRGLMVYFHVHRFKCCLCTFFAFLDSLLYKIDVNW